MRFVQTVIVAAFVSCAHAWDSVAEMETAVCQALTNENYLLSSTFTNQLAAAINSPSVEMKCEAYIMFSIHAYQNFLNTADDSWLQIEMCNASNAVSTIGMSTNKWQYWASRFVHAGAFCSVSNYESSFAVLSNALQEASYSCFTNNSPGPVERAIFDKFEMPNVGVIDAMRIMAGMSAAELGNGSVATNYANQVPVPFRNVILEFVK